MVEYGNSKSRPTGPAVWILTSAGILIWTLLVVGVYGLADFAITWSATNSGVLIETGKGLADKTTGAAIDALNLNGTAQQIFGLVRTLLGPALAILWAIGAAIILAVPWLGSRLLSALKGSRGQ